MSGGSGYRNPVIPGFHPDPSVCRVGDDYFLVTSTFTYFPGVPIFRSRNLVDWIQIGNVLDRRAQLDLRSTQRNTSLGVFAPTLRHHDDRFWMITTVCTHEGGLRNLYVTAQDPAGRWSDPIGVDVFGIDPDLAWDDDGNCWVHTALGAISRCRIDDHTGEVLDAPTTTWSGTGLQYPEARSPRCRAVTSRLRCRAGSPAGSSACTRSAASQPSTGSSTTPPGE
jgi:xylan 1,4-beta-xylosidase